MAYVLKETDDLIRAISNHYQTIFNTRGSYIQYYYYFVFSYFPNC